MFFFKLFFFLPTMPDEVLSGEIKTDLLRMEEIANKVHHTVNKYRDCQ